MCTGCQLAAVEAAATASRSWAFELQNRSAIEPYLLAYNGRKETDGCKACKKVDRRPSGHIGAVVHALEACPSI
jgi:hypothetical protein